MSLVSFPGNSSSSRNIIEFPFSAEMLESKKKKKRQNERSTQVRHENFPNSKIYCIYCWNFYESHLCVIGSEENGAEREVEIMYA